MEIMQEYKKQKLVPFGEFLPFEKTLRKLGLKKITEGHGSFISGNNKGQIKLENLNILPPYNKSLDINDFDISLTLILNTISNKINIKS